MKCSGGEKNCAGEIADEELRGDKGGHQLFEGDDGAGVGVETLLDAPEQAVMAMTMRPAVMRIDLKRPERKGAAKSQPPAAKASSRRRRVHPKRSPGVER
jgi:hypothetical protein